MMQEGSATPPKSGCPLRIGIAHAYAYVALGVMWLTWTALVIFLCEPKILLSWWPLPTIDRGEAAFGPALSASIDLLLVAIFGLQHSVMARPWFKAWTKPLPAPWLRVTYVHAANTALLLLVFAWQPLPESVWSVTWKPAETLLWGCFVFGWLLLLMAALSFGLRDLLGIDALLRWSSGLGRVEERLKTGYLYRWVSHPMYVGVLLAFWSTPRMSVGHLLFAGAMTVYVLVAVRFEERDLARRLPAYGAWRSSKGI